MYTKHSVSKLLYCIVIIIILKYHHISHVVYTYLPAAKVDRRAQTYNGIFI